MSTARLRTISRAAVLQALDEFQRIGRDAFLTQYGFGPARDYYVRDPRSGMLCDSKAVLGAAHAHQFPGRGPLRPSEFSGGLATVVSTLETLGFDVVQAGEFSPAAPPADTSPRTWSQREVELLVADYLQMLVFELTGQAYNKAARRRALLPMLDSRTESSVEFKRRNVSAVLVRLGFPYLRGYLPAHNAQGDTLIQAVEAGMQRVAVLEHAAQSAVERPAAEIELADFSQSKTAPPERHHRAREPLPRYFQPMRRDYLELEARNRSLGLAGEKFVLQYERWRLLQAGAGQLAERVEHASVSKGDGLGYDILSFEPDGRERYVEVKTTAFGGTTPFFVSANEAEFARQKRDRFALCRVFDFRESPRFFELNGPVEQHCHLDPATYRASLQ